MFKSIRWKITGLFVILVVITEILLSACILIGTVNYFHKDFKETISEVFNTDTKNELYEAAKTVAAPQEYVDVNNNVIIDTSSQETFEKIKYIMDYNISGLAISKSRFYAILDGKSGNVVYSSNNIESVEKTAVVNKALEGEETIKASISSRVMDYAIPLKSNDNIKYIVYVNDNEQTQNDFVYSMLLIMLYIIVASAIVSALIGNILSKSITTPIQSLTVNAKKLADGDMSALSPAESDDEIGNLTNSLLYLANAKRETTEAIQNEKTKVETILQNMNDGILAFDMKGKLIHVNPEAKRLLKREYLDDIDFDRFFKEINANISLGDLVYMKPDVSIEREIKLDDQYLHLSFANSMTNNKVSGVIVLIHDITRQEKLEHSRRDFVANVSHELRTPLTTIKSYSETLSLPNISREQQVRFANVIVSEADRMANIISDLLTLSELDENQAYIKPSENIDIRKMLENLVDRMSLQAKKKEQTLTYTSITDVPIIKGDYGCLERVFVNIISNALKYTPNGGTIEVFSSRVYSDITVKIKDTGIGIPADKLPHIFDRFYRVDKARNRDTGGTGLGLAIAKQSLESSFNGGIKITSEYNKGTEVTITIPVK